MLSLFFIDPGEVAICFGDDGTWCPLYKHDTNGQIHQEYSDGDETISSLSSDDDLLNLTQNIQTLNLNDTHVTLQENIDSNGSRTSSPHFKSISMNTQEYSINYSGK